ncbi:MAG: hypothetical protein AB7N76_34325 [Planctomycetota bacterium]
MAEERDPGWSCPKGLFLVLLLLFVGSLLLPAVYHPSHVKSNRTKCSNDLRQLALAAIQYGDDKRLFPHVGQTRELDGDLMSSDSSRSVRALVFYGYHDNPEGLICPSSEDLYIPIANAAVRQDMKLWTWQGATADPKRSPWLAGSDPALVANTELSYGLTRRGLDRNVASKVALAADRGVRVLETPTPGTPPGHVGNHLEGWNVVHADATVSFVGAEHDFGDGAASPGFHLRGAADGEDALALSAAADPAVRKAR